MDQPVIVIVGTAESRAWIKVDAVCSFIMKNGVSPLTTFNLPKCRQFVSWYQKMTVTVLNSSILCPAFVKPFGRISCLSLKTGSLSVFSFSKYTLNHLSFRLWEQYTYSCRYTYSCDNNHFCYKIKVHIPHFFLPVEEVTNLASRRLSVSPSCTSSTSHRNYSFRRGSVWSVRSAVSAEGVSSCKCVIYSSWLVCFDTFSS